MSSMLKSPDERSDSTTSHAQAIEESHRFAMRKKKAESPGNMN